MYKQRTTVAAHQPGHDVMLASLVLRHAPHFAMPLSCLLPVRRWSHGHMRGEGWHTACMEKSVQVVHNLLSGIRPGDALEREHRANTLKWLETTNDVFRRAKPATPERHLVSYVVLVDPDDASILLVDHRNARLWLPPGGHVEPDEHPTDTARREAHEELGVDAVLVDPSGRPSFVTVNRTGGIDARHTDVSLWFLLVGHRGMNLMIDVTEFGEARWWPPADIQAADPKAFDPHFLRFVEKLPQ